MRRLFDEHPVWISLILFTIFSLSVSNIYVESSQLFLRDLGFSALQAALIHIFLRALISALTLFLFIPLIFYEPPRSFSNTAKELNLVSGYSLKLSILCGLLSFAIFAFLSSLILASFGVLTNDWFIFLKSPNGDRTGWLWLLIAINPALFEEMAFRGLLFTQLSKRYSQKKVIWTTSIFFGVFHFTGMANGQPLGGVIIVGTMATAFALSWGYMVSRTHSLIPSMIMHYLINAFNEIFVTADTSNEGIMVAHVLLLILTYPIISILVVKKVTNKEVSRISIHAIQVQPA